MLREFCTATAVAALFLVVTVVDFDWFVGKGAVLYWNSLLEMIHLGLNLISRWPLTLFDSGIFVSGNIYIGSIAKLLYLKVVPKKRLTVCHKLLIVSFSLFVSVM